MLSTTKLRCGRLFNAALVALPGACAACSAESAPQSPSQGGSSGAAGNPVVGGGQAGAAGSVIGSQGGAGSGAGAGGAAAGSAGMSSAGAAGAAGAAGQGGAGPGVKAGCANNSYAICLDFESGIDKAVWSQGSDNAISTLDKAHGEKSYHAYKDAAVLTTSKFGDIKNVMWGRFYLRMTPGAPGGHGNIVGAYQGGDWYELGWQFNGLMGVWHYAGGERPLRSHPDIQEFYLGSKSGERRNYRDVKQYRRSRRWYG